MKTRVIEEQTETMRGGEWQGSRASTVFVPQYKVWFWWCDFREEIRRLDVNPYFKRVERPTERQARTFITVQVQAERLRKNGEGTKRTLTRVI